MKAPLWWITAEGQCACGKPLCTKFAGGKCVCVAPCCGSPGKHPITRNGLKDASNDPAQIAEWSFQYPDCNWANVTGAEAGIVVVDLDVKPGKNGLESIKVYGPVPRTRTVRTGSGGLHLYFKHPGGSVPNTASKFGPGIDTRGDGGYVVAEGSNHLSGGRYELIVDCEPADAPSWLVSKSVSQISEQPSVRGYFPAASTAVLEAARDALSAHGPAIEGNGGDLHTFRACAILVHDFALTEDEAWPLLVEWNEECQPSWSTGDLRSKLRGGDKYGKAQFGCKRQMDARAALKKHISDWDHKDSVDLVKSVRYLFELIEDPTEYEVMLRDVEDTTGLKRKTLGVAPLKHVYQECKTGEIVVTTKLHEVADAAVKAIADHVFHRNGVLCEVVVGTRTFISDLEQNRIRDLMSQSATFVRQDEKGLVTQAAPQDVAAIIHSRRTHSSVRVLEAITTAPIFLADGSILQTKGYNEQARVYLDPSVTVDVPDAPTRSDAARAVKVFAELLSDFDFLEQADFSSWLAGLLSPLVKSATGNSPAPLICVSASSPGAGKSLLTEVIARIVTGGSAEIRPYTPNAMDEWAKRLTAFVKAGTPVNVFDNVNGPIGDSSLDRLITATTWSDRVLGASEAPPLAVVGTWYATGNNIEPIGDTVRRVLMVRTEVDVERPQERTGFKIPDLVKHVDSQRAALLTAALTILRAYHVADRPSQGLASWGSFTTWSELVRGALVWSGQPDPFLTQQRAANDLNEPENEVHDFWISVIEESDGTGANIVLLANNRGANDVLGLRESLSPAFLRRFIGRFVDKPRKGKRIRRQKSSYSVQTFGSDAF